MIKEQCNKTNGASKMQVIWHYIHKGLWGGSVYVLPTRGKELEQGVMCEGETCTNSQNHLIVEVLQTCWFDLSSAESVNKAYRVHIDKRIRRYLSQIYI